MKIINDLHKYDTTKLSIVANLIQMTYADENMVTAHTSMTKPLSKKNVFFSDL